MNNLLLVDTDILIDVSKNILTAVNRLIKEEQNHSLGISTITKMELIRNKSELRIVDKFLCRFELIKIDDEINDIAIRLLKIYRLSHGLLIADAFIAATSIAHQAMLLTKNQKDFRFIEGLKLKSYP
ncbi:MAG: type II toxin-antitoxin system VapC family toxin [Ignavibacteriaceae bacterium]|nr:type II toxin-antitoxin system VapC family toxin [Ignavibacteriaceae bacterium]